MLKQNHFLHIFFMATLFFISCKKDATPVTPLPTELLSNSNLEAGSTNWATHIDNKHISISGNYALTLTDEFAASPKNSLKMSCSKVNYDTTFCYYAQIVNTPNIKIGSKLTLRAKIKGVNLVGQGVSIAMAGFKKGKEASFYRTTEGVISSTGTFDFKEISVSLESYQENMDMIVIYLVLLEKTTGVAYFDDISLTAN